MLEILLVLQLTIAVIIFYIFFNKYNDKNNIIVSLEKENSRLNSENIYLKEYSNKIQQDLKLYFENYTNKIVSSKSDILKQETTANINNILQPLKEKINDFQQKVDKAYQEEARERFSLKNEISKLVVNNANIIKETESLTNALKGSVKAQGIWGELILEKVLESSGLTKGVEYITQGSELNLKNEDNKTLRPDVIINLPDGKHIIVDAKVSLVNYEQYNTSLITSDKAQEQESLALFIKSLQNHINNLSSKNYQYNDKLLTPDFVIMFFPIEGAFSLALQTMPDLLMQAWNNKIIIVSPTTLFATLKTIASIWLFEKQNKNALKIASESGRLYDKFVMFTEDLEKIGQAINKADDAYHTAVNKLSTGRGNIVAKIEKIKLLGAKTKKQLAAQWQSDDIDNELEVESDNNLIENNDDDHDDCSSVRDDAVTDASERELLND